MSAFMRFYCRLANAFRGRSADADASREIAAHLQLLQDEFTRRGLSAADARVEAHRALGSAALAADLHRDARSFVWLDDLRWDLGYGVRLLRRNPLFALTAALSLAVGIGANTTVFTIADALLFRPPAGVADANRLVDIGRSINGRGFGTMSYLNYLDIRERATTLEGVYAYPLMPAAMSFADADDRTGGTERVFASPVSNNYFSVLGTSASAGRLLGSDADRDALVVLGHRFWTRRFGKNPAVVGRTLVLNGRPFTVAGVAAEGFQGTGIFASDLWMPLTKYGVEPSRDATLTNRGASWLNAGARLKPGVRMAQAAAEIEAIGRALAREFPDQNRNASLVINSLAPVPGSSAPLAAFVTLLVGIVSLVLLVACANLTGVLLARAATRQREIAVRLAIGAGRARLVRQLLVETMLLFALGAVAGLLLARGMTPTVIALLPTLPFQIDVSLALDARAILFTAVVSLVSALLSGLAPALHASKADVVSALKDDALTPSRPRLRHAFVVAQVAFSILLVVVAGLFARALVRAGSLDPGFDSHGVELATVDPSIAGYTDTTGPLFAREVIERVRRMPRVEEATIAAVLPGGFERIGLGGVAPAGAATIGAAGLSSADWNIVEPRYFATLHMPFVAGRDFGDGDAGQTEPVVIVGEGVVRRFWPGTPPQDAVGKFVVERSFDPKAAAALTRRLRVVGVVRDPTYGTLVDATTGLYVYVPVAQQYHHNMMMIVARTRDGTRMGEDLRALVASMNPNLPIMSTQTADEYTSLGLVPQRIVASVSASLGLVGVLLAALGIYGVTAYAVTRRTREIGIRIALGAQRVDVMQMILREGMRLAAIGAAIGLTLAASAGRLLSSFLLGVAPIDAVAFAGAAALFAAVGLAACYMPARRATRIDAMEALRYE